MQTTTVRIKGTAPLLMHNGQLADPMNEMTRALSEAVKNAKKAKTDAAYATMQKAEFMGGLYLNEKLEPCIPGEVLEGTICEGAKKFKQGKDVKAGLMVVGNFPLIYKGPRDPEKMWKTGAFHKTLGVIIGRNRVMRTRPMFVGWEVEFAVTFNEELINPKDVLKFLRKSGAEVGIGDYRPRYGRFEVVE